MSDRSNIDTESPRKSLSAMSLEPNGRNRKNLNLMPNQTTQSCESLYSNPASSRGSASLVYCNRNNNKTNHSERPPAIISASTEVRQRVLSARRLRMKTFQNQIADAQQTIADLAAENRILRTMHKRQDSALAKYESTNAELPKLLHSHAEEVRVWQAKYRNLQNINRDLESRLKQKEAIMLSITDQNRFFNQLNKDKSLEERHRLTEKVQQLEQRLHEKDNDMKLLARKLQLETKLYKKQLVTEHRKIKDLTTKLDRPMPDLSGLDKLEELVSRQPDCLKVNRNGFQFQVKKPKGNQFASNRSKGGGTAKEQKELEKVLENASYDFSGDPDMDFPLSQRSSNGSIGEMKPKKEKGAVEAQKSAKEQSLPPTGKESGEQYGVQQTSVVPKHTANDDPKPQQQEQSIKLVRSSLSFEYLDDYERSDERSEDDEDDSSSYVDTLVAQQAKGRNDVTADNAEDDDIDDDDGVIIKTARESSRMKDDITNIRKQITEDYKDREAFLDTFCRQATSNLVRDEPAQSKRSSATLGAHIPANRKSKLLAALQAIDDSKALNHD